MQSVYKIATSISVSLAHPFLPMGSGLYLYDVGYIVPYASDERFIPEIIRICNSENVQLILVGVDAEVAVFSKFKDLIETKTKAKIVSSSRTDRKRLLTNLKPTIIF